MSTRDVSERFETIDIFDTTEANINNVPSRLRSRIQNLSETDSDNTGEALLEKLNEKEKRREERLLEKNQKQQESKRLANERRIMAKEIADIPSIELNDNETALSKKQQVSSQKVSKKILHLINDTLPNLLTRVLLNKGVEYFLFFNHYFRRRSRISL